MNRDTGAALNSMTGENNKKITVEEISSDDVCDNCGAEPSDIELKAYAFCSDPISIL